MCPCAARQLPRQQLQMRYESTAPGELCGVGVSGGGLQPSNRFRSKSSFTQVKRVTI